MSEIATEPPSTWATRPYIPLSGPDAPMSISEINLVGKHDQSESQYGDFEDELLEKGKYAMRFGNYKALEYLAGVATEATQECSSLTRSVESAARSLSIIASRLGSDGWVPHEGNSEASALGLMSIEPTDTYCITHPEEPAIQVMHRRMSLSPKLWWIWCRYRGFTKPKIAWLESITKFCLSM